MADATNTNEQTNEADSNDKKEESKNCKCLNNATHIIFDLDGTLLDTEKFCNQAFKEACAEFGGNFTEVEEMKILGTPSATCTRILIDCLNLKTTPEEFLKKYKEKSRKLIADAELMPGAEKLVKHLHKNKIPMAIATSSTEESFRVKMKKHREFLKMFDHYVVTSDPEVRRGKPFPDIFLVARRRFREAPKPEHCLVIEDSPNGLKAARAANMACVLIPDPKMPEELRRGATMILECLDDFNPQMFGLPGYEEEKKEGEEETQKEDAEIKNETDEIKNENDVNKNEDNENKNEITENKNENIETEKEKDKKNKKEAKKAKKK